MRSFRACQRRRGHETPGRRPARQATFLMSLHAPFGHCVRARPNGRLPNARRRGASGSSSTAASLSTKPLNGHGRSRRSSPTPKLVPSRRSRTACGRPRAQTDLSRSLVCGVESFETMAGHAWLPSPPSSRRPSTSSGRASCFVDTATAFSPRRSSPGSPRAANRTTGRGTARSAATCTGTRGTCRRGIHRDIPRVAFLPCHLERTETARSSLSAHPRTPRGPPAKAPAGPRVAAAGRRGPDRSRNRHDHQLGTRSKLLVNVPTRCGRTAAVAIGKPRLSDRARRCRARRTTRLQTLRREGRRGAICHRNLRRTPCLSICLRSISIPTCSSRFH